ncbi:MAG: MiaB/RimO family radical SAM methylthiotransferase [candidate division SR1 bacterium]|nr:MiaB/RimO family radical SAM methylthiotransferase [candidate division SR1 bacterium]
MKHIINFSLINLGCTKNLVDSQYFLGRLFDMSLKTPEYQLNYFTDPFDIQTNIVFLNTCAFISSGRDEASETVKKLFKAKKTVYLLGCAVQYYKKLTKDQGIKNVHYLSRGDLNKVNLKNIMQGYDSTRYGDFEFASSPRVYTNLEQKFEYLKIAEGCDNHCTFCIIPAIRGKQQSLTIEKILAEAKNMIANGIKEIILIAQDTTRYGTDLYGEPKLLELLKKLDAIKGDFTYRLLYLYPDIVTLNQVKALKKLKKFIPYFDIPLQHISSPVLKNMGRFYDEGYIIQFIDQIKKIFPVRFIRTNLIIGFPGETKEDFDKLVSFVDDTKFDNIALFEYHDEPMAASSKLKNKVDDHEIRTRFTKLRQLVNKQLLESENARKGNEETGYIMEIEKGILVVRPQLHCPEIDAYDEITVKQVIGTFEDKDILDIGDKITYKV